MVNSDEYESLNNCDDTLNAVRSTRSKLQLLNEKTRTMKFLFGFDGYRDELYEMVRSRSSVDKFIPYESMAEFGQKIISTAGSSGSIERVLKKKIGGGFSVNTARAVANMAPNSSVSLYGAMGYPTIDPLFTNLPPNVSLHSIGNSGVTLAMEFSDGKIMSQDMGGIFELTWTTLLDRIGGRDVLIDQFENTNAIGQGHWSLMLHMNDYWRHFLDDIIPNITNSKKKIFFVDPADLTKRSTKEIREMLFLLKEINEEIPVLLSVNDREAIDVARVLAMEGVPPVEKKKYNTYEFGGQTINKVLNLSYFVIHEPHFATISGMGADESKTSFHHWVTEGYTSNPKFTTAAGDHFNGGILLALLGGLAPSESLVVGNAATAIFVRTGHSPNFFALDHFISEYMTYISNDIDTFCYPE
jgi:hypothetical protein